MTETKKFSGQVLRLTLILFLVTAITAAALALVNGITKDRIAAQKETATKAAYQEVLAADSYEEVSYDTDAYPTVTKVSSAGGLGYVVELAFAGAQNTITAVVGVDTSGAVTGVSIISQAETSGLGAKAADASFRDQYIGVLGQAALTKNGGTIEAISGATITSSAVTGAVNTALAVVKSLG